MRKKISIIGAGSVGSTLAQRLLERTYADIVLHDIIPNMPQGKALDLRQANALLGNNAKITGTNDFIDTKDSTIVVLTSGFPRVQNMDQRTELFSKNKEIITSVTKNVVKYSPKCILIVITNPLNAMAQIAFEVSGFPRERVIGMAGNLDAARMRSFIAEELAVSTEDIQLYMLGEHGDNMIPLVRLCTVGGIPITELLSIKKLETITTRTRNGGMEIIKLLGKGSTYFAPSAAVLQIVDAIMLDKKSIISAAAYLQGEYGIRDLFMGVPVKLGAGGIEEIIKIALTKDELALVKACAKKLKNDLKG